MRHSSPFGPTLSPRRVGALLSILLFLFAITWWSLSPSTGSSASIPIVSLLNLAQADLARIQESYIQQPDGLNKDRQELGFDLRGDLDELGLDGYSTHIRRSLKLNFGWDSKPFNYLSLNLSPGQPQAIPKEIYTSHFSDEFPTQLAGWLKLNPEHHMSFLDDAALDAWVHTNFAGTRMADVWNGINAFLQRTREGEQRIRQTRKFGAIKADLFRLVACLVVSWVFLFHLELGVQGDVLTPCYEPDFSQIPRHHGPRRYMDGRRCCTCLTSS